MTFSGDQIIINSKRKQPANLTNAVKALLLLCTIALAVDTSAFAAEIASPVVTPIQYDDGSHGHPFGSASINLAAFGYTENEYMISGSANIYTRDGTWGIDGKWGTKVVQSNVPYVTRMLVRRPINADKFNGTVVVEWVNVSAAADIDVIWGQSHTELLRDGYAWVGVSAQTAGVTTLKSWDSQRYASLSLSDDRLSYDIFSQVAQAIRSQSVNVMGELTVKNLIGGGESQSSGRMFTYVNAFQQQAAQLYDGILIYSRGASGTPIDKGFLLTDPAVAYIRSDNIVKVMQLETEQDVSMLQFGLARQDDTDHLRTWETAGTSHVDGYGYENLAPQLLRDLPGMAAFPPGCKQPMNALPFRYVVNAALVAFTRWIENSQLPPHSPRIEAQISNGKITVVRDQHGNAKGGIRLPQMEVPTAVNNFDNSYGHGNVLTGIACSALGATRPFNQATLSSLYPTHAAYVSAFTTAAKTALDAGFMVQADYDEAVAYAAIARVPH